MAKLLAVFVKKLCLVTLFGNVIYFTISLLFYNDNENSWSEYLSIKPLHEFNVNYNSKNSHAQISTTSINYTEQIQFLLKDVEQNKKDRYWMTRTDLVENELKVNPYLFMNDNKDDKAWKNKNTLFQDPRMTLALYINHIRRKFLSKNTTAELTGIEVPFHWADWVDLTFLNKDLELKDDIHKCRWLKKHSEHGASRKAYKCYNRDFLTPAQLADMGLEKTEQVPGYIQFDHSEPRATNEIRLAQAKSYVLTNMPNPFKLLFLNKEGGTYEVDVKPERQRIVSSGLMNKYVKNNLPKQKANKVMEFMRKSLTLKPSEEFAAMKKEITASKMASDPKHLSEMDPQNLYRLLHSKDANSDKSLPLSKDSFQYGDSRIETQIELYKRLEGERNLTRTERGFLESLELSLAADTESEYTYFKQSTLINHGDDRNHGNDPGWHYDWRFFNGGLKYEREGWNEKELDVRTNIILEKLLRNWFRFTQEKGFVSWIMHGPLLSWYWNGLMFPFDNDIDVQMPIKDMVRLGELYNQTLVIEDVDEGYGKFLVDIGTFIHNRDISRKANHIDARFIDVDTGIYIDITGLSVSDAVVPIEYAETDLFDLVNDNGYELVNDRRKHFYKFDQISPLKYTMMNGVPLHIPKQITKRLRFEYPNGVNRPEFSNWFFVPKLRLWLRQEQLTAVLDENDTRFETSDQNPMYDNDKIISLVIDITDEELFKLLENNPSVLSEYYLTKELTAFHEKEVDYLFRKEFDDQGKVSNTEDKTFEPESPENLDYLQLLSSVEYSKPLRKPLFQYEKYDQPKHHV